MDKEKDMEQKMTALKIASKFLLFLALFLSHAQADRLKDNGLINFTRLLQNSSTEHLDVVHFAQGDIERHEAVKEVLQVYGDH